MRKQAEDKSHSPDINMNRSATIMLTGQKTSGAGNFMLKPTTVNHFTGKKLSRSPLPSATAKRGSPRTEQQAQRCDVNMFSSKC